MNRDEDCLVGIDVGTGGCKVTIINSDGKIINSANEEYPTYYPRPGWAEQNPNDWYNTVKKALIKTNIKNIRVDAVCVDGQVHTPVFLNENWEILRPSIPWIDQRSTEQVELLKKVISQRKIIEVTFNPPANSFTLPQILWVKNNQPEIWRKVYKILLAKDYIRGMLTEPLWCTDHSDAIATLMFDGNTFKWSKFICESVEIPMEKLPEIVFSSKIIGHINKKASSETGIPEGTPVICGGSDCSVENLAAGTIASGGCFVKLATSGVISITTDKPTPDFQGRTVTYCLPTFQQSPELWLTKSGTASCASAIRWFKEVFCKEEVDIAKRMGKTVYELIDDMAEKITIGSEGLFFHPYLIGELSPYFDPHLKGSFYGITLRHRKEHFCRAVLEGIAFSIRDSLQIFEELGLSVNNIRLIGGGANSHLWGQIICDVLGKDGLKPAVGDASFGSALLAGIGIKVFKDMSEAVNKCVKIERIIRADAKRHKNYEKLFKIYKRIHDNLADIAKMIDETLREIE